MKAPRRWFRTKKNWTGQNKKKRAENKREKKTTETGQEELGNLRQQELTWIGASRVGQAGYSRNIVRSKARNRIADWAREGMEGGRVRNNADVGKRIMRQAQAGEQNEGKGRERRTSEGERESREVEEGGVCALAEVDMRLLFERRDGWRRSGNGHTGNRERGRGTG